MDITITKHGRQRLEQRGITVKDIEHALTHRSSPNTPGQIGSCWVWGYSRDGRILKVCVATDDHSKVITAAWPDA